MRTKLSVTRAKPDTPWGAATKLPVFSTLARDLKADVCVIGAGIAGLSTAYHLAREKRSVVVLDDGALGTGMTGATTAHLTSILDDRFQEVRRVHGAERLRLTFESQVEAIASFGEIVARERIDCDFERLDGYLFLPPGAKLELLQHELEAAREAGAEVERVARCPWPDFDTGPALRFPSQARIHPMRFLGGLARAIERRGGKIFTGTHADEVFDGAPATVRAGERLVECGAVVVATNSPFTSRVAVHLQQTPFMTYAIGVRVPKGAVPPGLFYDFAECYHYVRTHPMRSGGRALPGWKDDELLIVGGEDHRSGRVDDEGDRHARLAAWTRERFPAAKSVELKWGGQVLEPADGLALIGRAPGEKHVYIVTGDSGMGMTHGMMAGAILRDEILGHENALAEIYDPSRFRLKAAPKYAREITGMAAQLADWAAPGDVGSPADVRRGGGAVVRRGLAKFAVHRSEDGALHVLSAVCPHLGCVVDWNDAEKSWDCPCHGSRFSATGELINGPANRPLEAAALD
jgi:glycine/D-amino acid oxidase-like deaminating enzyme/nitrite reductase/ring-hydroxylating ferredoxin subunit